MTEISAAPLFYVDTNVFIAGFALDGLFVESAKQLFSALRQKPCIAVTSELTLAELLAPVKNPQAMPLALRTQIYGDLLLRSQIIKTRPVTRDILLETGGFRHAFPQKLPVAIHMVTALKESCRFYITHDADSRRMPQRLSAIRPDSVGVQNITEILHA